LQRILGELHALSVLRHAHIVVPSDAGEVAIPNQANQVARFLVMEYVPGQNLQQLVRSQGPLPVVRACELICQAATGLRHAHEFGQAHGDIKPSHLMLTPQEQVKILDYGIARIVGQRGAGAQVTSDAIAFQAPEVSLSRFSETRWSPRDPNNLDIRADIFSLGATLYWLLTGQRPIGADSNLHEPAQARPEEALLDLRRSHPDLPLELEAVICQMMARDPNDRYATPLAAITALHAFLERTHPASVIAKIAPEEVRVPRLPTSEVLQATPTIFSQRILIASADAQQRTIWRNALSGTGRHCIEAASAAEAREELKRNPSDLILLDASLPNGSCAPLCQSLRNDPPVANLKIVLLTAPNQRDDATVRREDVDERIPRDAPLEMLQARVRLLLRLKEVEGRADRLASHLVATQAQLEQAGPARDAQSPAAQDVLIFAMAKMAELRGLETGAHLLRMQEYVRVLAEEAARSTALRESLDETTIRTLERCVLLHDIGKVAIPDSILLKPGRLENEERSIMEAHTILGASMLEAVACQRGATLAFLDMAIDIARHHHERFDGTGYPDGLVGNAIPLPARITAVADVYDALRSKLVYKPGLSHVAARRLILDPNGRQFDPALLESFRHCEARFDSIFEQTGDVQK
jgi:response regulator RpfG family c-di-GMP phosphodiesterase